MTETFSVPDDFGPPTISEMALIEKARVITDAHTFIVPLIWLGAAVFFWLGMRFLFAPSALKLRRRLSAWLARGEP